MQKIIMASVEPPQYNDLLSDDEYLTRVSNLPIPNSEWVIEKIRRMKEKCSNSEVTPHSTELLRLMNITYPCRHMEIYSNFLSVRNTITHYPGLGYYDQVEREFERVTGKNLLVFGDTLMKNVFSYNRIRNVAIDDRNFLCENAVLYLFHLEANVRSPITYSSSSAKLAAEMIIFVSDHFQGEWLNKFVVIQSQKEVILKPGRIPRAHPFISIRGEIFDEDCATVYCERTKILSNLNFWDAILSCYYLHYIFNLSYCESDEPVFHEFDAILGIS